MLLRARDQAATEQPEVIGASRLGPIQAVEETRNRAFSLLCIRNKARNGLCPAEFLAVAPYLAHVAVRPVYLPAYHLFPGKGSQQIQRRLLATAYAQPAGILIAADDHRHFACAAAQSPG